MARMRAEPSLIADFIEETLRYDPPIQCSYRCATADTALQGVQVSRGAMVVPLWAAAGWDPAVFEQPSLFDPARANVRQHMGFGYGQHFCAGAALAGLEARIAFETLLSRFSHIELGARGRRPRTHLGAWAMRRCRGLILRVRLSELVTETNCWEVG